MDLQIVATCQEKEKSLSRNLFDSGKTDVFEEKSAKIERI